MEKGIVTRFAPSPTGNLHIGGCRTAIFNWLYARKHSGKMILRIEDTDKDRNSKKSINNIIDGLKWLGLNWDGEIKYQSDNITSHIAIAKKLLEKDKAYLCYCTPEELDQMRKEALKEGKPISYNNKWRNKAPSDIDKKIKPTIRLKTPLSGITKIEDTVQGTVVYNNSDLDDFVLLRSDGSPTYMLASVVDDFNMGVTNIIRGDDHLNNAARQMHIYNAMKWPIPSYTHIPLIHSDTGTKLSKRDGVLSITEYRQLGYIANAVINYLLRLGWSHGDKEYFTKQEMIDYFDIKQIHKSPARLDFKKLTNMNSVYLKDMDEELLVEYILNRAGMATEVDSKLKLNTIIPHLKTKSKNLNEIYELGIFLLPNQTIEIEDDLKALFTDEINNLISDFSKQISQLDDWSHSSIEAIFATFLSNYNIKLIDIAKPLRIILTGRIVPTGIYEILLALGKDETINRISNYIAK